MSRDGRGRREPTRRDCVKYGGALVAGGSLAGCTGGSEDTTTTATGTTDQTTTRATTTTEATPTEPETETTTTAAPSYSVTMSPAGTVEFDAVPESVAVYTPLYADAATALGHGDAVNSLGYDVELFGETIDYYYDALDGVSFEWDGLARLFDGGLDKEAFYRLDSDLHLMDPAWATSTTSFGWSQDDLREVTENVAPFLGNYYSRENRRPPEGYRDDYRYYTLWELVEKLAAVFRERERYEALKAVRDDLLVRIRSNLPPAGERPSVAMVAYASGAFWPYEFDRPGYLWAHTRPMGVTNAFDTVAAGPGSDGSYDYEGLVAAQPDVVLRYWGAALGETFVANRETVLDDPLAAEVPAFADGRYYASGNGMQGPIMNLFQLEMTAKQLYPGVFGEWPGFGDGTAYPEIPAGERLFDRQRVAEIVRGEV